MSFLDHGSKASRSFILAWRNASPILVSNRNDPISLIRKLKNVVVRGGSQQSVAGRFDPRGRKCDVGMRRPPCLSSGCILFSRHCGPDSIPCSPESVNYSRTGILGSLPCSCVPAAVRTVNSTGGFSLNTPVCLRLCRYFWPCSAWRCTGSQISTTHNVDGVSDAGVGKGAF